MTSARSALTVERLAAFSDESVAAFQPAWSSARRCRPRRRCRTSPPRSDSETAFAARQGTHWRVRYHAPDMEVPFLRACNDRPGAALARAYGEGVFPLVLNDGSISVAGNLRERGKFATLESPTTRREPADAALVEEALRLFTLARTDLDLSMAGLDRGGRKTPAARARRSQPAV